MSRKIFLSFLGTNDYVPCNYFHEGDETRKVNNVKYVQEAVIRLYCQDFTADSVYLFFLTDDARTKNWANNGHTDHKTKLPIQSDGLATCLAGLQKAGAMLGTIQTHRIEEGFTTAQIWSIFDTIHRCLLPDDEVIMDITHAFRSLPMLGMVLMNYAQVLQNVKIKQIHYGAFEKLGPAFEVKQMPLEQRNAAILDLISFSELQKWTTATNDFKRYGNTAALTDLLDNDTQFKALAQAIHELTAALSINHLPNAFECIEKLNYQLEQTKAQLANEPSKQQLANLVATLPSRFQKIIAAEGQLFSLKGFIAQSELIAYYLQNEQQHVQAITVAREALISRFCILAGATPAQTLDYHKYRKPIEEWLGRYIPLKKEGIKPTEEAEKELFKLWQGITTIRNPIDHAFMKTDSSATMSALNDVEKQCKKVRLWLEKDLSCFLENNPKLINPLPQLQNII
jgi:CRISPR-associated Csx2 family protein